MKANTPVTDDIVVTRALAATFPTFQPGRAETKFSERPADSHPRRGGLFSQAWECGIFQYRQSRWLRNETGARRLQRRRLLSLALDGEAMPCVDSA